MDQDEVTKRVQAMTNIQATAWLQPCLTETECEDQKYYTSEKLKDDFFPSKIMHMGIGLTLNASYKFPLVWPDYACWQCSISMRAKHRSANMMPLKQWNERMKLVTASAIDSILNGVASMPRDPMNFTARPTEYTMQIFSRCSDDEMDLFKQMYPLAPIYARGKNG